MNEHRIELIEKKLKQAFSPKELLVKDQSHLHAGHAGAKDGRGHFDVVISAAKLSDCSRVQAHRLIYDALGDLMQTDIHALKISIRDN
ncbi:MAG: BolA family transcriptional regulator [Gammaproteobacteria bacterium]|nr:BolA family transcriptional regulator [Gammaproteobacteria bacterium]